MRIFVAPTGRGQVGGAVRGWLRLAGVLMAVLLLAACNQTANNDEKLNPDILSNYLPKDWHPVTVGEKVTGFQPVNLDGDADKEWLYFFHYDGPAGGDTGPIGGILYDAQPTVDPQQPAAYFVPYRLLPDWREGKGQGYLGDTTVAWSQTWRTGADPSQSADELAVTGYSVGNVPSRLSIFRWLDKERGYGVNYFSGEYGVSTLPAGRQPAQLIQGVVTLNTLNERSRLCQEVTYTRQNDTSLSFVPGQPRIVFCGPTPEQPMYPEAVVLAWILNGRSDGLVVPGQNEALKAVLGNGVEVRRVESIVYPGAAQPAPAGSGSVSATQVVTALDTSAGPLAVQWNLYERVPTDADKTSRWRIASAQRLP